MYSTIRLKAGREASVGFHHPWIFSGALESVSNSVQHGDLVYVSDRRDVVIGTGTYSSHGSIAVRVFAFRETTIDQAWITACLQRALERRCLLGYGLNMPTTGYRLVHGESDALPGLVIDVYRDVVVIQISTAGMDKLRDYVVGALKTVLAPSVIFEKSDMAVRHEEELENVVTTHYGTLPEEIQFVEQGHTFVADVNHGQKTGFFLDQKDLRASVAQLADGKRVLNLFSYTGAAAIYALKAGAVGVHNVDSSDAALAMVKRHAQLNELNADALTIENADIFQWLGQGRDNTYDMVLLDPPALAKSKADKEAAMKGYHFLNRAAMRLVSDGGIFVTSSCSHYIAEDDLSFSLRRASVQAGVELHMLKAVSQGSDHPLSVYFPEGRYLKSYVFEVRKA